MNFKSKSSQLFYYFFKFKLSNKMKKNIILFFVLLLSFQTIAQNDKSLELVIKPGEYWWAGISSLGHQTPYDATTVFSIDMWGDNHGNQAQPLLLSSMGRYVWSDEPIKYDFNKGKLTVTVRDGKILNGTEGNNLRSAYEYAVKNFVRSNGKIREPLLFPKPQ